MKLKKLTAQFVAHKRVLLRVDYNTPLKTFLGRTVVADNTRLKVTLPTLHFLLKHNAKIIITSHLGRPKGPDDHRLKMDPVAKELEKLLKRKVIKIDVPAGPRALQAVNTLPESGILLLENSRFDPGEKKNSPEFAQQLAELADVYVNDALSASHRAHASVVGVTKYLPSAAGLALAAEVDMFTNLMRSPQRPFVAIVGGAKISDKVEAIRNLSKLADVVLVGGGVANNFLKADGVEVYHSYLEETASATEKKVSFVSVAEDLMAQNKSKKMLLHGYIPLPKIMYPSDVVAADSIDRPKHTKIINLTNGALEHPDTRWMFLDIGPKTQKLYRDIIQQAKTVFWNGPMGVFENSTFAAGTKAVAQALTKSSAYTVIGGGDTISAIRSFKLEKKFNAVSAAGGAALEFLGGKLLPGLEPLLKK